MEYLTNFQELSEGTEICIYGASGAGRELLERANKSDRITVKCFVDTYKSGELLGLPIIKFEQFKQSQDLLTTTIVIASAYDNEISWLLQDAGVQKFYSFKNIERFIICRLVEELLPATEKISLLDIGARDPLKTTFWLSLNPNRLKVHGFDADDAESEKINQAAKIENLDYTCYPIALWSEPGKRIFYHTPELPENSSFFPHDFDLINNWKVQHRYGEYSMGEAMQKVEEIEIEMDTLNNWKKKYGIGAIDFAKLNIEGAELDVLKGGEAVTAEMLGLMAEASFVDFNRPMFSEMDEYIRSQGFEFFDFWVTNAIGRQASPISILSMPRVTYKCGQVVQGYPVYFRNPVRMQQKGMDLGMFNRNNLLKLAALAETFLQIEFAFEVLQWAADFLEKKNEDVSDIRQAFEAAVATYREKFSDK